MAENMNLKRGQRQLCAVKTAVSLFIFVLLLSVSGCGGKETKVANTNTSNSASSNTANSNAQPSPTYDQAKAQAEQKRLDDYIEQFKAQPLPKRISAGKGYIKGKALIIKKEEDERYDGEVIKGETVLERCYSLEDRCVETPGAHSTVIYIKVSSRRVGRYSNGSQAFAKIWNISIIDLTIPAIVATKSFEGWVPDEISSSGMDKDTPYYSDEPSLEFQEYIQSLPVR